MDQSVNVAYTADTSQYMASMGEMITATARYGQVTQGITGKIAQVGTAVTKTAVDLATMGKGMNTAVQTAAAYQQALSKLEARSVVTGDNFRQLGKDVRQMARDLPGGMDNAIQQVDALNKMGVTAKQNLVPLARTMTEIGAASGELGPGLTQSFAQLNRTFKSLDVTSVERIGASLTQVSASTGASASSIVEFSNAIAPLSSTLGMTKTQVLGFSAAFSRSGQDGYLAANVMNKMLGDMERAARDGTGELTTYATAVGKTTEQFSDLVKSNPGEALTQVFDSLSQGGSASIRTLEKLGFEGPRAMKTLTAVAQAGGVREAISAAQAGYGGDSTAKGAEAAFGGLNDELTKVQESMTQLVEASGRPMLGFLENAARLANTVASGFAKLSNSDFVQQMMMITTFGGGIIGTGMKAASVLGTAGGIKQLLASAPGFIGGPMGKLSNTIAGHKGAFIGGGIGALGLGAMTGNSTMSMLGGAALLMSNMGADSMFMRGARRLGAGFVDTFWNQPWRQQPITTLDSMQGVKPTNKYGQKFANAAGYVATTTGIPMSQLQKVYRGRTKELAELVEKAQASAAMAGGQAAAQQKIYDTLGDDVRASMDRQNPFRNATIAAGKSLGVAAGGTAKNLLGAAAGFLGSGAGLATVGVGAGIGGYMLYNDYQGKKEKWGDQGFNSARTLSEQYGIALAPVADFSKSLSESVKTVDNWNEAMNLSGERLSKLEELYKAGDTESVRMQISDKATLAEVVAQVQSSANSQSPAFMSAVLNDVALQRGTDFAQQVADQVKGTQGSPAAVTASVGQILSDAEKGWWSITPGYTGQSENVEQVKGATEQYRAQQEAARQVGGLPAQSRVQLEQFTQVTDELLKAYENGTFDEEAARELAKAIVPADQVDFYLEGLQHQSGDYTNMDDWMALVSGRGRGHIDELRAQLEEQANKPVDPGMIKEASSQLSESSKNFARALTLAQNMDMSSVQLQSLWKEGAESPYVTKVQDKLAPGQTVKDYLKSQGMTEEYYNAAAAVERPSNVISQFNAVRPQMGNALGNAAGILQTLMTGNLSEGQRESLTGQLGLLQQYGMPQQLAGMGAAQSRGARMSFAKRAQQYATANPEVEGAQDILNNSLQMQQQVQMEELQYLQQRARAAYDYRKQETRAWEDYYQERAWAQEDFQQSQQWAEEDFYRQRGYTLEDFHRQQKYAQEDFDKSMTRMAEDTAKGIINPWQRMQSEGIWSLEGMNQNVAEQQQWLKDQLDALDKLKERGLSQQAIDTFGLADPSKAQQVSFYANADQSEIDQANRIAKRQARLGKKFTDPELNVSARRAVEDFTKNTTRAQENLAVQLGRMDEAFKISTERASIQFAKQMDRMATKMSKSMARMHQDFIDQDKEVLGSKKQLMRQIENVYEGRTAKWGPIFGSAMGEIKKQNTSGWQAVSEDSDKAMLYIGGTWQQFSLDGTVPKGANPFSASSKASQSQSSGQNATDNNNSGNTGPRGPQPTTTNTDTGKKDKKTDNTPRRSSALQIGGGKGAGPVSGAGETGNWGADLKAKYTALADALVKYGPLNRVGLIKGGKMTAGGTKAAAWLWQQMLADGLTQEQAAGILGNLDQESGFSPTADQANGPGRGIAQWSEGGRWEDLKAFAKANKMDPNQLGTQYAFMRHEMSQGWGNFTMKGFSETSSPQEAASYFGTNYEAYGIEGGRRELAQQWFNRLKKLGAGKKEVDEQWKSAGLWDIGDEIVRRGEEYEKLLKQIKREQRAQQRGDGPSAPVKYGMKHGDLEVDEGEWGPPVNGLPANADNNGGGPAIDFPAGPGNNPPIFAAFDGTVHSMTWPVFTTTQADLSYGNTLVIRSPKGIWYARYAHLMKGKPYAPGLHVGAQIKAGQHLGWVGGTGSRNEGNEHLHFEVGKGGVPAENGFNVNPFEAMAAHGVRLALGGVATRPTRALIAEAGSNEAVIPLNGQGVSVIAEAIGKYAMTYEARMARTAQHGTATVTNQTYIQDYSTQFNGEVKVVSNDPDDMARKLEARQRRRNTYAVTGRRGRG